MMGGGGGFVVGYGVRVGYFLNSWRLGGGGFVVCYGCDWVDF